MAHRRSLIRTLRSRKLAVWLLAGIAAWSAIGTSGLDGAFVSPIFLTAVWTLALSTALCAWERTRHSWQMWQRAGLVSEAVVGRLRDRSSLTIPVSSTEGALGSASAGLAGSHLRVRSGTVLAEGSSGRWGLFGSPLFHWSLVMLILFIGAGQLTRSEGLIGIPVGGQLIDDSESYRVLDEGPLYGGHTGLEIGVPEMPLEYEVDGIDRGAAPVVTLSQDGAAVAEQRVHPNRPLRYGSLLIHMDEYGFAPTIALLDEQGELMARDALLVDFDETTEGGLTPVEFGLVSGETEEERLTVRLTLSLPAAGEEQGRSLIEVFDPAAGDAEVPLLSQEVRLGDPISLPDGEQLVLESVGYYARLSVADDWSVPFIYLFFALAGLGISIAVLVPYRRVLVLLHDGPDGPALHVDIRHSRGNPLFAREVERAIRSAVEDEGGDSS